MNLNPKTRRFSIHRLAKPVPQGHARVISMGNFDGVHLGHQALLGQAKRIAEAGDEDAIKLSVVSFEPAPAVFFNQMAAGRRIMSTEAKRKALLKMGVHEYIEVQFEQSWATMPAPLFVEDFLLRELNMHHLVVGDDVRFGHGALGDLALLQRLALRYDFGLHVPEALTYQGQKVSSSRIRAWIAQGRFDQASAMLGAAFSVSGKVFKGQQKARLLGYPTANLIPQCHLLSGVYAARVWINGEGYYNGIVNAGVRPTIAQKEEYWVEVHLLNEVCELYGRTLEVQPLKHLRDEQKFASFEALKQQIHQDVKQVSAYFS